MKRERREEEGMMEERDREVGRDGTSEEIRKREDGCGEWAGRSSITGFSQSSYMFVHHVDPQVHFQGRQTVSTTMADHPLVRTSEPSAVKYGHPNQRAVNPLRPDRPLCCFSN
jgi:hypothetical protein